MAAVAQLPELPLRSLRDRVDALTLTPANLLDERPRWLELRFALSVLSTFCVSTVVVLLAWILVPTVAFSWSASAVTSASMEPSIERGDVVVFHPVWSTPLDNNTIVAFQSAESRSSIVHRVVGYDTRSDEYTTQGDANPTVDSDLVHSTQIDGVGALLVPIIGYPLLWAEEGRIGLLALVAIGSLLVLISSQTAPQSLAAERGPQVNGPLTPTTSAAAKTHSRSLFPADLARQSVAPFAPLGSLELADSRCSS